MSIIRRWGTPWSHGDAYRVNHASFTLVTPPAVEPVTRDEAARFIRVDFTSDDPLIGMLIAAARQRVENFLRRALITQTRILTLDWGPAWVELPYPPIQSVTSVTVKGLDFTDVVASPSSYYVNTNARLVGLQPSAVWPTHVTPAGWRVQYVAGYGADATSVPDAIKLAILHMVAISYDTRGTMVEIPEADKLGMTSYRIAGQPFRIAKGIEPPELLA